MTFKTLYDAVQAKTDRISTDWLKEKAIEFSAITVIREQWSGVMDGTFLRGFYIEGPMAGPVPVGANEALIVLARTMCLGPDGKHWRRLILTKEIMHVFDTDDEKTAERDAFDKQIQKLKDPSTEVTPQFRAELKAFWRALAVLCNEKQRQEYKKNLQDDKISWDVVAAALRIPIVHTRNLMSENFDRNLKDILR